MLLKRRFDRFFSTEGAILDLTDKGYNAMDTSKPYLCMFVVSAKAFDRVSHTKRVETLENVGFQRAAMKESKW